MMVKTNGRYVAALFLTFMLVFSLGSAVLAATTIDVWSWRVEDVQVWEEVLIPAFEKSHPGYKINFEAYPVSNYTQILQTSIQGGEAPDIAYSSGSTHLDQFIRLGAIRRLDDSLLPELREWSDVAKDVARGISAEGLYMVPVAKHSIQFYYNRDLFARLGLDVPRSVEEFTNVAEILKENGMIPIAQHSNPLLLYYATGPSIMTGDWFNGAVEGTNDGFQDPRHLRVLELLVEWRDEGYYPKGFMGMNDQTAKQIFLTGQAGMFVSGSWEIAGLLEADPDFELGVFAFPGEHSSDPVWATSTITEGFMLFNDASEGGEIFMKWIASQDFGARLSECLTVMSTVPGVTTNNALIDEFAVGMERTIPFWLIPFNSEEPQAQSIWDKGSQQMLLGEITPVQLAERLQSGVSQWYEPFQK